MMERYRSLWNGNLGKISVAKHRTESDLSNAAPIQASLYRAGPRQRNLEREEVYQMIKAGVAEPIITERASPIIFVSEKNESVWFCVDYRLSIVGSWKSRTHFNLFCVYRINHFCVVEISFCKPTSFYAHKKHINITENLNLYAAQSHSIIFNISTFNCFKHISINFPFLNFNVQNFQFHFTK